jgi:predicted NBD/HSP70 family sugar kinase
LEIKPLENPGTQTGAAEGAALTTRRDLLVRSSPLTPSDRSIEKRRLRKYFVLNVIREKGPLSRAEIAKASGLNLPSVSSLVDELVSDGLASEEAARHAVRGRRPIPVVLIENAVSIIGIDIGKSSTMTMVANLGAKVLQKTERPTPHLDTPEDHARWALQVVQETLSEAGSPLPPLCGIGVALPGLISVQPESGDLPQQTNGKDAGVPGAAVAHAVQKALSDQYDIEVFVDNDARLMVPGMRWFSSRPASQNFAVLNIGYGLGLGISLNGRLLSGAQGFAGELGHIPLGRPEVSCFCGGNGCLENTASGAAISAMARERGLSTTDVEELAKMARAGDAPAKEIFAEFAGALGRGIATIINLFNPETIVLTGKVSRASDVFWDDMMNSVSRHALPAALARTTVVVEQASANLSLLGAVAVVLHHIFYSSRVSYEEVI